ncbi:MAG TPA: 2-oxo-4-hydroxy-4-carboxy-5-ureidoimidazoline decarboxylase, partial [Candidatus Sulfopaludibacter sp.]|nr:2-oxo-4-hydroxy-4-carboxy-5-ureidoimidazoline decarboxylase [Candidatus Sulfopaludibacter sp.]
SSVATLHAAMIAEVEAASAGEQLALLRAHPDLGARARLSDASAGEQAGAGLDRLTPAELTRLRSLNAAYRQKFGFPFLYAVRGATKYDILQAIETRLAESPGREFLEALRQVYRIAGFRLQDTVS